MSNIQSILESLKKLSKEERQRIYDELGKMVKNERSRYILTAEQKIAIAKRKEKLYADAKGEIPKYIFSNRLFHKELNDDTWHE